MGTLPTVGAHGVPVLDLDSACEIGSRVVGFLASNGHEPGERIAFRAATSPTLLAAVFGVLRGGYAAIQLSDKLTARELAEMTSDIRPALVFDTELLARAATHPATGRLGEQFACRPIHFTSGTSGRPKAVWSGWLSPADAAALAGEEIDTWGFCADDVNLLCGPLSHSAPLRFALFTLITGGRVLVPPAFSAPVASELIASGVATSAFMAPAHLQRLFDGHVPARTSMRLLAHAGSPCPDVIRRRAMDVFGMEVLREFYGSTEGQFTVCTPQEWLDRPGTVGRARPGRALRIADDDRIWCQVPSFARFEYWGDAAKTAQAWDGDWFTVGDLGRLDNDGYLYLDGRRSDLIITGGVNVYPAEIERIVETLPGVQHAIAFGVDDERWGQKVCLAVVGKVTAGQVADVCASQLAPFKRPKKICLVSDLPMTHSGKVARSEVASFVGLA